MVIVTIFSFAQPVAPAVGNAEAIVEPFLKFPTGLYRATGSLSIMRVYAYAPLAIEKRQNIGDIVNAKRTLGTATAILFAALVHIPQLPGSEVESGPSWPEFHGPGRTNISPEKGPVEEWPEGGPPLVWKYSQCGKGYSGVSIAEGMIFTAGDFGEVEMLLALDLDGKLLWKSPNGEAWRRASPGSRTTPTYDDGVCII